MFRLFRHIILLSSVVFLAGACRPGVPSGMIQPSELEDLLYDYHLAQAMAEQHRDSMDYLRYEYVRAVFDKYGVTEAEFDSTMVWYSAHSVYLNDIYKRLKERFENDAALVGEATGSKDAFADLSASGDTANIWHERTFRVLKPRFSENRMQFVMNADSSFLKGDELMWRFEPYQIAKKNNGEVYAGLYIRYDNDSTAGAVQRIYSNSTVELRVGGDTARVVKSIGGFVCYKTPEDNENFRMLILDRIMLVRFHKHVETVVADSAALKAAEDSVALSAVDTLGQIQHAPDSGRRLSPQELRDSRPTERSIHVVKEKPYAIGRSTRGTRRSDTRRR